MAGKPKGTQVFSGLGLDGSEVWVKFEAKNVTFV